MKPEVLSVAVVVLLIAGCSGDTGTGSKASETEPTKDPERSEPPPNAPIEEFALIKFGDSQETVLKALGPPAIRPKKNAKLLFYSRRDFTLVFRNNALCKISLEIGNDDSDYAGEVWGTKLSPTLKSVDSLDQVLEAYGKPTIDHRGNPYGSGLGFARGDYVLYLVYTKSGPGWELETATIEPKAVEDNSAKTKVGEDKARPEKTKTD